MNVQDASNPGIGGIVTTVTACSSQCSNYAWSFYVQNSIESWSRSSGDFRLEQRWCKTESGPILKGLSSFSLIATLEFAD